MPLFFFFCHSGIKIEQNFSSSWTLPCDATVDASSGARARTRQQNSGNNNPAFQENNSEGFSEKEMMMNRHTAAAPSRMQWRSCISCSEVKCVQTTSYIFTTVLPRWPILQLRLIAFVIWQVFVLSSVIRNFICGQLDQMKVKVVTRQHQSEHWMWLNCRRSASQLCLWFERMLTSYKEYSTDWIKID